MRSHRSIFNNIFETAEQGAAHHDKNRGRLTLTESIVAVTIGITCVTFMAIFLVDGIPYLVEERNIKDAYVSRDKINHVNKD